MKRIIVSVGVAALGATVSQVSSAAGLGTGDQSKVWSISASLRGFYDDNYVTSTSGERDTFGVTISPSIALNVPLDQTTWSLRYTYGATWYEDRSKLGSSNGSWDQSHEVEGAFSHTFSEHNSIQISDSFVVAQEPALIDSTGAVTLPFRTEGDNIRNHAEITFNGGLTKTLSYVLGYQNTYYDYQNEGTGIDLTDASTPSLSGLLDRMEHEALANLRWQSGPKTVLVLGYNYRQVEYISDEAVANVGPLPPFINSFVYSDARNSRSHIIYGGIDQNFNRQMSAQLRAGAQHVDYYKQADNTDTTPWINANLLYQFRKYSTLQLGASYMLSQTDLVSPDPTTGSITTDSQSLVIYGTLRHRFMETLPNLTGSLHAQWQKSEFNGGTADGLSDSFFDVGVNLTYRINNHFSTEAGYNFSTLTSDVGGRKYDRNRVYLGVIASY
jgi:hypothetical protein